MPRKSEIDIFKNMTHEELDEALESNDHPLRYYKRLMAMRLIEYSHSHKETAKILKIGYRTVYRWAKKCEKEGLKGLELNFNGGRKSKFTNEQRTKFKERLIEEDNLTMTDAKNILEDEFELKFSLTYVCQLVRDLGFSYGTPRPKFDEEPENSEEILKKTLKMQM